MAPYVSIAIQREPGCSNYDLAVNGFGSEQIFVFKPRFIPGPPSALTMQIVRGELPFIFGQHTWPLHISAQRSVIKLFRDAGVQFTSHVITCDTPELGAMDLAIVNGNNATCRTGMYYGKNSKQQKMSRFSRDILINA